MDETKYARKLQYCCRLTAPRAFQHLDRAANGSTMLHRAQAERACLVSLLSFASLAVIFLKTKKARLHLVSLPVGYASDPGQAQPQA